MTVIWAAGSRAPIDVHCAPGRLGLLIGYAIDDAGMPVRAVRLADEWLGPMGDGVVYDGYHVGIAYDSQVGLAVGADALGLFPLHHAEPCGGAVVVSTTPRGCACHPSHVSRVDRLGLAGVLMTNGLVENRTLLAGIRRVPLGHRLRADPNGVSREVETFRFAQPGSEIRETAVEMRERIWHELLEAIKRHRPQGDDALLMLSGGLDSRLIAACLADAGIPVRAVSLGSPKDYESRAAAAVAQRTQMPFELVTSEPDASDFVSDVRRSARFTALSAAPSGDDLAAGLNGARTCAHYAWSGIPFDWIFEPVSRHSGFDIARGTWSFEEAFGHINAWGVPIGQLPALLGPDGQQLCAAVLESVERLCTQGPLPVDRQSALFRWEQRVRSHLANSLHKLAFVSWPIMISTDRRLFGALYWLPHEAFPDRRLQKDIIMSRRPDLAAIPLDTNSFRFDPLASDGGNALRKVARSLARRARRAIQPLFPAADARRYERLFNVDHPRWIAVRQDAERLRSRVEQHLDPAALSTVWPSPHRRLRSRKPIERGAAIRLLVGLAYALDE